MENTLAGRDLLRLLDLTPDEVDLVVQTALNQKASWRFGIKDEPQKGKAVAIIMEKPSMRTRVSFEVGVSRLGATPIVLADENSAFSRGESVQDTTLVLERYVDAIVLRTFDQTKVEEVAEWASVPVINALTDDFHPCQVLADLVTIAENFDVMAGLKLAYVGDGNNMAQTYLEAVALTGMHGRFAWPEGYGVDASLLEEVQEIAATTGATIDVFSSAQEAVEGADVVITDTWVSMGDEKERAVRLPVFEEFQVDEKLMSLASPEAIFMHCLPAHRGEEVTDAVMDGEASVIYDEAENRLHAQKAVLSLVMDEGKQP